MYSALHAHEQHVEMPDADSIQHFVFLSGGLEVADPNRWVSGCTAPCSRQYSDLISTVITAEIENSILHTHDINNRTQTNLFTSRDVLVTSYSKISQIINLNCERMPIAQNLANHSDWPCRYSQRSLATHQNIGERGMPLPHPSKRICEINRKNS